ncbi:MAG: hypothetical protein DWQ29_12085, partial [Planctomycetota bacterium]
AEDSAAETRAVTIEEQQAMSSSAVSTTVEDDVADRVADVQEEIETPETPASGESSAAEQVALLNAEVQERDALIAALTDQLEEAANRLDRMHRQGADRAPIGKSGGPTNSGSGVQEEVAERISRLTDVVSEWHTEDYFGEIFRKLDEIRDSIAHAPPGARSGLTDSSAFLLDAADAQSSESGGGVSAWEGMKAEVFRRDEAVASDEQSSEGTVHQQESTESVNDQVDELLVEVPEPIELEVATDEQLRAAVEERDDFISRLIRRLRTTAYGRYEPIDWEQLAAAPEDMRERLEDLESRLQELLRLEECELSLERARLARDRAELEQLRQNAVRNGRANFSVEHESPESERERRWLRVFGFGKQPENEERPLE